MATTKRARARNGAPSAGLRPRRSPGPDAGWLWISLAVIGLLAGARVSWPRTVDDSFITYRYSENLAHGRGAVFNPGERVEGYSSPSWMLVLAAADAVGLDPEVTSKLLGLASSLLLLALVFQVLRRAGVGSASAGLAACVLGVSPVFQLWSVAGLETNAYALLFFAGWALLCDPKPGPWTPLAASSLLAAAALTRPEGAAFWVLGLPLVLISRRSDRLRGAGLYLIPGVALAGHELWRLAYYGSPFPNTYYAKVGGGPAMWRQGVGELADFVLDASRLPWLLAAAAGALHAARMPAERRRAALFGGAVILHAGYVVSVGGDGLFIHRFFVPILPFLAVLAGLLFLPARPGLSVPAARSAAGIGALLLAALLGANQMSQWSGSSSRAKALEYQEGNVRLGRALASTRPPGTLVAVAAAGAIPYYSRLPVVDMYGLNDAHIARGPFPGSGRERLLKWDNDYVLARQPQVIVINRGYRRAGDPGAEQAMTDPGILAVAEMDRDLFEKVAKDGHYELSRIPFSDGAMFFVFERAAPESARSGPAH